MKNTWIWFVASRYIFKGRSNSPVLSVLGIATGVLALIIIIAVMNGFQLGFIESIIEISSYHLRLESFSQDDEELISQNLLSIPEIKTVVPFREFQAIARGKRSYQQAVIVRGIPENACQTDQDMAKRLDFEKGFFDIHDDNSILLGTELAKKLGLSTGDAMTLYSITELLSSENDEDGIKKYVVTGIFRTGYYEYDCTLAFVNIQSAENFLPNEAVKMGIKINNRFNDKRILNQIQKKMQVISGYEQIKFSGWRDYNKSFFGALRTEKLFMFILVGIIFIVVGLNIYQGQRRSVLQKREEIGLLRAVGGTERMVRFVFVLDGAIIGFTGAAAGLIMGLLIANNIPVFFTIVEYIVNTGIKLINMAGSLFGAQDTRKFAVFSPTIFYIKEIPSRIIFHEVVIIFLFGSLSALCAAWFASRKIAKINPAEVLRYE